MLFASVFAMLFVTLLSKHIAKLIARLVFQFVLPSRKQGKTIQCLLLDFCYDFC